MWPLPRPRLSFGARYAFEYGLVLLALVMASQESAPPRLELVSRLRTPPLGETVLDLAFLGDERLIVLTPDSVLLYALQDSRLELVSRHPLPVPLAAMRAPAGLVAASEADSSLWVMTSRSPQAVLFGVEAGGLVERLPADALPWPGCPGGLRYRMGTNLLEGRFSDGQTHALLALESLAEDVVAVDDEGRLLLATPEGLREAGPRVGSALAALRSGLLAASSAAPPGAADSVLFLERDGPAFRVLDTLPIQGAVRALAARARQGMRLVVAVQDSEGRTRLELLDLRRPQP